ncbi:MAG TPA: ornithine cyclodeaminase family protein [Actinomycetota bacterium]|nr:ornithine cyclodeaminase family protein [Actinomycetota bacterium]
MLVLNQDDVRAVLDLDELVDALARALSDVSAGTVSMPARVAASVDERDGLLAAMPSYVPSARALATKLVSLFPHNADRPTHQAVVVCFDPRNGTPVALLDGTYLTAARTAAGSALATRLLARPDARVLAILGTGVQARSHARAVTRVRRFDEVRVAGRRAAEAARVAAELASELDVRVVPAPSFEAALDGADVVCATTHAADPVVRREWLDAGTHVSSVGYNTRGREVDAATVVDAYVVVEARSAALAPPPAGANDLLWPLRDGLIDERHVRAELGELVTGAVAGRTSPDEITLYKSVGIAAEDAAAAALVLRGAAERGVGTRLDV